MTQDQDFSDPSRQRLVSWRDPSPTRLASLKFSGQEIFQKILAGELPAPPIARLMGMNIEAIDGGRIEMTLEPGEYLYNPIGSVHGGAIATILDSVMGCAVHLTLSPGRGYSTLELKINYIRSATIKTGRLRAIGETIHVGRRSAVAEAKLFDADGKLYASGSSTCLIFDLDRT